MGKAPCYGCDKRKINCHSECDEYLEYRQQKDSIKEARKKHWEEEYLHYGPYDKRKRKRR